MSHTKVSNQVGTCSISIRLGSRDSKESAQTKVLCVGKMGEPSSPMCASDPLVCSKCPSLLCDEEMETIFPGQDSDLSDSSEKLCGSYTTSSEEGDDEEWFPESPAEYVLSTPTWADMMDNEELENPDWFKEESTQLRKPKQQQLVSTKLAREVGVRIALENSTKVFPNVPTHKRKPGAASLPRATKSKKTPRTAHPKQHTLKLNHMKAEEAMAIELKTRAEGAGISGLASTLMSLPSKTLQHQGYTFAEVLIPQNHYQHSKEYPNCKFATLDIPKKWGDRVLFILKV
jgi:hypothetical protein